MDLLETPKQLADLTDGELMDAFHTHYSRCSGRSPSVIFKNPHDPEMFEAHLMFTNARISFEIAREIWERAVKKRDRYKTMDAARKMGHSMCLIYRAADALEDGKAGAHD